jgi:hypothetical protein
MISRPDDSGTLAGIVTHFQWALLPVIEIIAQSPQI